MQKRNDQSTSNRNNINNCLSSWIVGDETSRFRGANTHYENKYCGLTKKCFEDSNNVLNEKVTLKSTDSSLNETLKESVILADALFCIEEDNNLQKCFINLNGIINTFINK